MANDKINQLFFSSNQHNKILFGFMILIFLFCLRDGVLFSPDSDSYIHMSSVRIGLYPLMILLFQNLFKGYALQALVIFQLGFTFVVSYHLATFLKSAFKLPTLMHWVLIGTFLSPLIVFKCANEIMSEGLAYPLFLVSSYFLLKGILHKNTKDLLIFSFTIFLLSFTRQQYLFFYGIGLVLFLFLLFFVKGFQKKSIFLLSVALSLTTFFAAERAYHFMLHGSFSQTPFVGCQFVIRPLFLATEESYKDFTDPKQRQLVRETMEEIINQKIIDKDPHQRWAEHYFISFTPIARVFVGLAAKIWPYKISNDEFSHRDTEFKYTHAVDQQTTFIALMLIKNNFLNYVKSYIKDVILGFGGYAFFSLAALMSILCLLYTLFYNENTFCLFFIFAAFMHLGNLSIVCLFEPVLTRYSYSTNLLLTSMLFIMGYQYIRFLITMNRNKITE